MLVELMVENYAVIERVRVRFHPGLNLLTGRSRKRQVDGGGTRWGCCSGLEPRLIVLCWRRTGAYFRASSKIRPVTPALAKAFGRCRVEPNDNELLVEREIQASGKSRALVGNTP